ncbi:MAG: Fe2+-dependent dioxygenase [Steroidobacteraceae bacterium]|nr:Fe2+-dependent dioxygenase [Steroidobacteraceae bacterium]
MLLQIPGVLRPDELAHVQATLGGAEWVDGRVTAGHQSARAKHNRQLPEDSAAARELGRIVVAALERHPLFVSAALPLKIFPPLFNRYESGESFGVHIDNAIRMVRGSAHRVRTDLSATLFLGEPADYDGGELVVEDTYGAHSVKLPAGHLVLYPASSLHKVQPVTRGARIAAFFWVQSMIREDAQRALLFDLDGAIQRVAAGDAGHPALVQLTGVYHNLLRRWADA